LEKVLKKGLKIRFLLYFGVSVWMLCTLQGCTPKKPLDGSENCYWIEGVKIVYSFKGSSYIMGESVEKC